MDEGLQKQFDEKKRASLSLKHKLNELKAQRDVLLAKKRPLSEQIRTALRSIKENKQKRDAFTQSVKAHKLERDKLNDQIKELVAKAKELNKEKRSSIKKFDMKADPSLLRQEIEQLESKVETQALTFAQESKLMKQIKDLRKQYQEAAQLTSVWDKVHGISSEINTLRAEADKVHQKIQHTAKESQAQHEALIEQSKDVRVLRQQEKAYEDQLTALDVEFKTVRDALQEQSGQMQPLKSKIVAAKEGADRQRKAAIQRKLKDLEKSVEEKMKRGEKLTTEDLIAFQGGE